jgi:hypothetical protein
MNLEKFHHLRYLPYIRRIYPSDWLWWQVSDIVAWSAVEFAGRCVVEALDPVVNDA